MSFISANGETYWHEKKEDGGDQLSYRDNECNIDVVLEFPSASEPGVSDEIIKILSDVFIDKYVNVD